MRSWLDQKRNFWLLLSGELAGGSTDIAILSGTSQMSCGHASVGIIVYIVVIYAMEGTSGIVLQYSCYSVVHGERW